MTFPNLPEDISPNIDLNPEDVALLILISIAFEELALAHVINSEAEKLQAALGTLVNPAGTTVFPGPLATDLQDLLDTNRSVEKMLRTVIKKEMLLQFKLEDIIDFLPTVTTTGAAIACGCSVTPVVNVTRTGIAAITTPAFPPAAAPTTGASTLHIVIDICSDCTPDNAFNWSYVRTPGGFSQDFIATSFNVECLLNEAGVVVGMLVTGEGIATGSSGGFTGDATYVLLLDEVANTATLLLFNKATGALVFQQGPQVLGVDIEIAACP